MGAARWTRYGEAALSIDLDLERAPDRAARTHAAAAALRARLGGRAAEVVVGAGAVVVVGLDPALDPGDLLAGALDGAATDSEAPALAPPRSHVIPVVYDGPDLAEVAAAVSAAPADVVAWHSDAEVVVELLGFMPGFAYCSGIDARLVRPRRPAPRPSVPAGSVAIAGGFTGIYPFASPGGWSLLGRAAGVTLFDPDRDPPLLFAPGDRVRFTAVEDDAALAAPAAAPVAPAVAPSPPIAPPALDVVAAHAVATVQDAGRPGQLARGLPPSGPLDAETHAAANVAVGNPPGAAAIEIPLGALEIQAAGEIVVSIDGAPAARLRDGERLRVAPGPGAVRYLAVRGAVAVPAQLGARATLVAARIGGVAGRPLRRGDRIPVGRSAPDDAGEAGSVDAGAAAAGPIAGEAITLDPGPHLDRFPPGAMEAMLAGAWRISRLGDRVGVRLEGARVPREGPDLALPAPMIRGAIQVTTDGTPIVLGPDHPVTGGYPVLAVVRRDDQPRLARLRPGDEVRFRLGR